MIRIDQLKIRVDKVNSKTEQRLLEEKVFEKIAQKVPFRIVKKSIDARDKKNVFYLYALEAEAKVSKKTQHYETVEPYVYKEVSAGERILSARPTIVGTGPAGLFAGYLLAKRGYRPILIERGQKVEERAKTVEALFSLGILNESSNVQFGEGGAGTFSDGKLTTQIRDERIGFILDTFMQFGADRDIRYLAKPHVGTDVLRSVVKNMREEMIRLGANFCFDTTFEDFQAENGVLKSIKLNGKDLETEILILGPGHSARDTFRMLRDRGVKLQQKPFAVGVRIEHLQEAINKAQYADYAVHLPAADYKLSYHSPIGRSVYSFCMCPGGEVVAATSKAGAVVTNGMSYQKRDLKNANTALLMNVLPKDLGSDDVLSGVQFQEKLEAEAFRLGGEDYRAPSITLRDFIGTKVHTEVQPSYRPGVRSSAFEGLLPEEYLMALREGITYFGRRLTGFDDGGAVLTGIESRSSSPVRILRDDHFESSVKGIYPIGEGAGYAGGITSSAVDGLRVAEEIIRTYRPFVLK